MATFAIWVFYNNICYNYSNIQGRKRFKWGNYSREETVQGRKLYEEIQYTFKSGSPYYVKTNEIFFIYIYYLGDFCYSNFTSKIWIYQYPTTGMMCSQNYKNFLWACWPLSQNLTTGPCSNQLQRPPPLLDDTLTLQKQWELVDWMNFFASSFDSFTLTASYFLLLTFRNQILVACFSFAA